MENSRNALKSEKKGPFLRRCDSARCQTLSLIIMLIISLISCKQDDPVKQGPPPLRGEIERADSLFLLPSVKEYAKIKTILSVAASGSDTLGPIPGMASLIRKVPEFIEEPSFELLFSEPTMWFEVAEEWQALQELLRSPDEDRLPSIGEGLGEMMSLTDSEVIEWSRGWEHLLFATAWRLGEQPNYYEYELLLTDPEQLGTNEISILGMWYAASMLAENGFPAHGLLHLKCAEQVLNSPGFVATGELSVGWMGTAREEVRTEMLRINEMLKGMLMLSTKYEPYREEAFHKLQKSMEKKPIISEFDLFADLLIRMQEGEYLKAHVKGNNMGIDKYVSLGPLQDLLAAEGQEKGVNSQTTYVMLTGYLVQLIWQKYLKDFISNDGVDLLESLPEIKSAIGTIDETLGIGS